MTVPLRYLWVYFNGMQNLFSLIYSKLRVELKKSFDFIWIIKTNVCIFVQRN